MHKLEKLILEQFASIQEARKTKDLPKEFTAAIEKRYGKMHPKDFFSNDLSRYMKFDGENERTGQVTHKVIPIASFEKMYDDFQDIVDDIKSLMRDKDVRTDKAARDLFELIRTNFRKLQRYLRTERPDIMWIMTDPRYWQWLWKIEDEIRAQVPICYYHVWDNGPPPKYNKKYYNSNDLMVSISKLTEEMVNEVGTKARHIRIPHTIDESVYKVLPEEEVAKFRKEHFGDDDKVIFFWNNRNTQRKNATTLMWWFKEFLDEVGHDKAALLMHTNPEEQTGSDLQSCLLYTSPSPRDQRGSRMPACA